MVRLSDTPHGIAWVTVGQTGLAYTLVGDTKRGWCRLRRLPLEIEGEQPGEDLLVRDVGRRLRPAVGGDGDANCDGSVDPLDAALILQRDAGLLPALPCGAKGDVDGDGQTNALDAALVLQSSAGLIDLHAPSATATPQNTPALPPGATNTPTATPTEDRPTATPTPTATSAPPATQTTTPARDPSLYWFDCRTTCKRVLSADASCQLTTLAISTFHCMSQAGGWEMDCTTSVIGGLGGRPHADCLHSQDGPLTCESGGGEQTTSSCEGPVWFGACSSTVSSAFHCWRTDALGTETVDCSMVRPRRTLSKPTKAWPPHSKHLWRRDAGSLLTQH